ncbi:pseudouridine synthase [Streptosporangium sp. NPDC004379]|uniref:pseudouridine synthase n=1 Tax=Streptosporangium sp. NPDC004379 TaxID=3366189 RepID=UPI00367D85EF
MNDRRSTPSGDGRGRGRGGAPRGGGPRGGGGTRGGSGAGGFRGGSRGGFRSDAPRRDDRSGGPRRDDRSDAPRRDDREGFRAERGGSRGGYGSGRDDRFGGPRRDDAPRGGSGRGERFGGPRRDDRSGGPRRDDRSGGFRRDDRGGSRSDAPRFRSDAPRRDDRFGGPRRDDRSGAPRRDDRFGGPRRDDREGFRAERGGSRGGYGSGRDDRSAGPRRDDRFGGSGGGERFGGPRRDDRSAGPRRDDRFGGPRRDDREGFRAERGGSRDRFGGPRRDDAPRGSSGRDDRFGGSGREERFDAPRRDDRSGGPRRDDAPRGGSRGRFGRTGRRDEIQTIGGARSGSYGERRSPAGRASGAPAARRPGGTANDRFKTARQPRRDPDFYDADYTDERDTTEVPGGVRLQKVLAQAGVASRRACEEMIGEGRVTVDGQVVRRFGARVDPAKQVIHVDGKRLPTMPDLVYLAINKPIGVVSTMADPEGRPSLADYVADRTERLFHVGRLDTETEGLILLTNDGELANRLTHPSYGVQKKYWAKVPGKIERDLGRRLQKGIELEDGIAKADSFGVVQEHGQQALVEIVLHEGRKHVVRRMLEEVGHPVIDLARIEFGPVKLGRLKPGTVRALTLKEVGELYAAVGL